MKKVLMAAIGLMMAICADAQYLNDSEKVFYQGKYMIGASVSGFDLTHGRNPRFLPLSVRGSACSAVPDILIEVRRARAGNA